MKKHWVLGKGACKEGWKGLHFQNTGLLSLTKDHTRDLAHSFLGQLSQKEEGLSKGPLQVLSQSSTPSGVLCPFLHDS